MSNVVNLNKFRKRKAKAERAKRAETNRRLHGRTKAERAREELEKRQQARRVDGAKLTPARATDEAEGAEPPDSE